MTETTSPEEELQKGKLTVFKKLQAMTAAHKHFFQLKQQRLEAHNTPTPPG